jgi:hypothetical protein
MTESIAPLGLATSVPALDFSVSQCAELSIHHATIISTKSFTATFTHIPAHIYSTPLQGYEHSSMVGTTFSQEYGPPGPATTSSSGSGATSISSSDGSSENTALINPSSILISSEAVSSRNSASASAPQSMAPSASGSDHQSSSQHSLSTASADTIGGSATPQWSTQSRYIPPQTTPTIVATKSGNSTSPKSSVIAFTGSSSTMTKTSGVLIIALLSTMFLL